MAEITTVQRVPVPESQAFIDTTAPEGQSAEVILFALQRLMQFADAQGQDISSMLSDGELTELGVKVCREFDIDEGSRKEWKQRAEKSLRIAAQEHAGDD